MKGKRDEYTGLIPIATHSQDLEVGDLHLGTSVGKKKEIMAVKKAFKSLPVLGC